MESNRKLALVYIGSIFGMPIYIDQSHLQHSPMEDRDAARDKIIKFMKLTFNMPIEPHQENK